MKRRHKPDCTLAVLFLWPSRGPPTCFDDAAVQQASGEEGLVLARADLGAHQLRAGGQDAGVLLVEVDAGHGRHVIDVVVIPSRGGAGSKVRSQGPKGETGKDEM